jgi:chorismate mutase/prephenate dehydrogenase
MSRLQELRARIRELDEQILRMVAARMKHAKTVGAIKKAKGIPLRDWEVEKQVLERCDEAAAELGLAPELAHAVMQTLISASRAEQERLSYSDYPGSAEEILIVGGLGKMGRWFADFFRNQGHRIEIYDTQAEPGQPAVVSRLEDGLGRASFVLIATPLEVVPQSIAELVQLGYRGTIFDIASLKGHLKPAIAAARERGVPTASLHPMFGPGTRTLSDKVVCSCDCGDPEATRKVEAFFRDTAATLVKLSLDEHDHIISHVLGLSHLINILFTKVLQGSGLPYERLREVGSTTFLSQMDTTATVIRESPELYYTIQRHNPYTPELYAALKQAYADLTEWVVSGDRQAFVASMLESRRWVNGDDPR